MFKLRGALNRGVFALAPPLQYLLRSSFSKSAGGYKRRHSGKWSIHQHPRKQQNGIAATVGRCGARSKMSGLTLNISENKVMMFFNKHKPVAIIVKRVVGEQVSAFKYLWVLMDEKCNSAREIGSRIERRSSL